MKSVCSLLVKKTDSTYSAVQKGRAGLTVRSIQDWLEGVNVGIQKYIDKRTTTKEENQTRMGPSSSGFAPGGLDGYIGKIAEHEREIKERRKQVARRPLSTSYNTTIASLHKRGCYTLLGGSCKRVIPAAEICGKLKILQQNKERLSKEQMKFFIGFVKRYSSRTQNSKSTPAYVGWEIIKKLNRYAKGLS